MKPFREILVDLAWLGPFGRGALLSIGALLLFLTGFSWSMPGLSDLERAAFDLRSTAAAPVEDSDPRIVLVTYNENTLLATGERLPLDRTVLAKALRVIDASGPRAIGIDMLFDQPQPDDALLLGAVRGSRSPIFAGYASTDASPLDISADQQAALDRFFGTAGSNLRKGGIVLRGDQDGVIRMWPDRKAGAPPPMALALAASAGIGAGFDRYDGSVAYRQAAGRDRPVFQKLPIELFAEPAVAEIFAAETAGKFVLIGGDFADIDRFAIPNSRTDADGTVTGLEVHAHMLAQVLDNRVLRPLPWAVNVGLALLSIAIGVVIAVCIRRKRVLVPLVGLVLAGYLALASALQMQLGDTRNLGVVGWCVALLLAIGIVHVARRAADWERGRTATLALHRYLPPDIAQSIVTRPDRLGLKGETRDVFVLFTDLEGFTGMCQSLEASAVGEFLNDYLEAISQVVLDHGGTIDKFVGDAVVAFWGAPTMHDDDAQRAVAAAIAILKVTETYRGREIGDGVPVGRTRIGLHYGSAIVGNFGGEGRLQYTALGDTMNVGARLEGANKELGTSILLSGEVYARLGGAVPCRSMGSIRVRGRFAPVAIYEPALDVPSGQVAQLNAFSSAALAGDRDALRALERWSAAHPDDIVMARFVRRIIEDKSE